MTLSFVKPSSVCCGNRGGLVFDVFTYGWAGGSHGELQEVAAHLYQ